MEGRCYVLRLFGPGLVPDLLPGCCPLSGLHVGLAASHPIVAVIACEMPVTSAALLETAARILVQEGVDVIILRSDRGLEPMHAAYRRKTSLSVIGQAIEAK